MTNLIIEPRIMHLKVLMAGTSIVIYFDLALNLLALSVKSWC